MISGQLECEPDERMSSNTNYESDSASAEDPPSEELEDLSAVLVEDSV